jgi:hypothetical protein
MKTRTATNAKQKPVPPCTNVELEFTQRFLSLFTSFYDTPSTEEITTFPPAPPDPPGELKEPPAKPPPFHSGVWDLRLKKAVEHRITIDRAASASLSEQVLQLRDSLTAETSDLGDIFVPRKAERPAVPVYIQNLDRDRQELLNSFKPRGHAKTENFAELEQLFSERLARQKEICKQRAQRRMRRQQELERQHHDFVGKLHKSKVPADADIKTAMRARQEIDDAMRKRNTEKKEELKKAEKEKLEAIRKTPKKPLRSDGLFP